MGTTHNASCTLFYAMQWGMGMPQRFLAFYPRGAATAVRRSGWRPTYTTFTLSKCLENCSSKNYYHYGSKRKQHEWVLGPKWSELLLVFPAIGKTLLNMWPCCLLWETLATAQVRSSQKCHKKVPKKYHEKWQTVMMIHCDREGEEGACFPIRVDRHPQMGRRIVATRDIKRGEVNYWHLSDYH